MRRLALWFFAWVAFVTIGFGCAVPSHKPAETTVSVSRTFSETLHVDSALPAVLRDELAAATREWAEVSDGNVRIRLAYDLDLDSIEDIQAHDAAKHPMVIALLSEMTVVAQLDKHFGGPHVWPLGVTVRSPTSPTIVFFILDRIPLVKFRAIAMHEFGHVIGLPDLPEFGNVMSGADVKGQPVPNKFTLRDRELCAEYRFCRHP